MTSIRHMPKRRTKTDDRTFAQIVHDRRVELDWSQVALAKRLSVGQQTVSRWESGDALPRPRTVRELAHVLGLPSALILMKAGYLSEDEMPDAIERPEVLDRITSKFNSLSDRDKRTIENMVDVMLDQKSDGK